MAVAPIFVIAVVISTAIQIKAQVDAAEAAADQAFNEEQLLKSEKRSAETQAIQEEVIRREELRRVLSAGAAAAGGAGSAIGGRGFFEATKETRRLVERDIVNTRVIGQGTSFRNQLSISSAQNRQDNAISQGRLGAFGAFAGGVASIAGFGAGGGFSGSSAPPATYGTGQPTSGLNPSTGYVPSSRSSSRSLLQPRGIS